MFTGLVEATAEVRALEKRGPDARFRFGVALDKLELGESIACAGVCLTVTNIHDDGFDADASTETLAVTTLGELRVGSKLNIERASRLGDRMGGHMVLGHVDGVGAVARFEDQGDAKLFAVSAPANLQRYLAPKGSLTVDGVSLTINRLSPPDMIEIMLVPHTLAVTTLGALSVGDRVNLEVDVLARYVARQLEHTGIIKGDGAAGDERIMEALQRGGYLDQ